ncbi:TetR/AcrR family transcriptional regulator [Phenylobacterium sp. LjRoot219]|uniref:TetR/AcrR family transcriptional regulator n=1 Tax=Phenylobacterium sp. LjRoot219 TaxID=3342283 RepID=UPI003ECF798E
MSNRRTADAELSRKLILDATERLMVDQGYASVSTRRVATEAGLKPSLVHYYYKTTDDLVIALYHRETEQMLRRLTQALGSEKPLEELWKLNMDRGRTVLAVEFLALANHRPALRAEIALHAERFRSMQAGALARVFRNLSIDADVNIPRAVTVLVAGVTRALVMEDALGISAGHEDAHGLVDWLIQRVEATREDPAPATVDAV